MHARETCDAVWRRGWCGSPRNARNAALAVVLTTVPTAWGGAEIATEDEATRPLPRSVHNIFVVVVLGLVMAWMAKIFYQLLVVADLRVRLANVQSLQLEGMSVYANDFQLLIRQHFNQILRIRRTVPPKTVPRYVMSAHLHPDSIGVCLGEAVAVGGQAASPSTVAVGVKFTADVLTPCSVRLYWGVSAAACNDFVHRQQHTGTDAASSRRTSRGGRGVGGGGRGVGPQASGPWSRTGAPQESQRSLLEMEELDGQATPGQSGAPWPGFFAPGQYVSQSRDFFLPAGVGQLYTTPAGDLVPLPELAFDLTAAWLRDGHMPEDGSAVIPLAIVVQAQGRPSHDVMDVQGHQILEAHGQVSFVCFRRVDEATGMPQAPEVVRQLTFAVGAAYEVQGIYGFEDEGEGECMVCYTRPKNVLLLPCRHCSVCHPCLRSLRDEKCPLCRSVFSSYITFPICRHVPTAAQAAASGVAPMPPPRPGGPPPGTAPGDDGAGGGNVAHGGDAAASQAASGGGGDAARTVVAGARAMGATLGVSGVGYGAPAAGYQSLTASGGGEADDGGGCMAHAPCALPVVAATDHQAGSCQNSAAIALTAVPAAASATPPLAPDTRQARDVQLGRPRGVAPAARTTSQGLRLSGRARFSDRTGDNTDAPLLENGGGAACLAAQGGGVARAAQRVAVDSEATEASCHEPLTRQIVSMRDSQAEETRVLITAGDGIGDIP